MPIVSPGARFRAIALVDRIDREDDYFVRSVVCVPVASLRHRVGIAPQYDHTLFRLLPPHPERLSRRLAALLGGDGHHAV